MAAATRSASPGTTFRILGRIVSIIDVYDALSSDRPYRPGRFTHADALDIIYQARGLQFDPDLVAAFLAESGV